MGVIQALLGVAVKDLHGFARNDPKRWKKMQLGVACRWQSTLRPCITSVEHLHHLHVSSAHWFHKFHLSQMTCKCQSLCNKDSVFAILSGGCSFKGRSKRKGQRLTFWELAKFMSHREIDLDAGFDLKLRRQRQSQGKRKGTGPGGSWLCLIIFSESNQRNWGNDSGGNEDDLGNWLWSTIIYYDLCMIIYDDVLSVPS